MALINKIISFRSKRNDEKFLLIYVREHVIQIFHFHHQHHHNDQANLILQLNKIKLSYQCNITIIQHPNELTFCQITARDHLLHLHCHRHHRHPISPHFSNTNSRFSLNDTLPCASRLFFLQVDTWFPVFPHKKCVFIIFSSDDVRPFGRPCKRSFISHPINSIIEPTSSTAVVDGISSISLWFYEVVK